MFSSFSLSHMLSNTHTHTHTHTLDRVEQLQCSRVGVLRQWSISWWLQIRIPSLFWCHGPCLFLWSKVSEARSQQESHLRWRIISSNRARTVFSSPLIFRPKYERLLHLVYVLVQWVCTFCWSLLIIRINNQLLLSLQKYNEMWSLHLTHQWAATVQCPGNDSRSAG